MYKALIPATFLQETHHVFLFDRVSSSTLDENPIKVVSLSETTRDAIYEDIISLRVNAFDISELQAFIESSKAIMKKHLSQELLTILSTLNDGDSPTSAVLFRNIPVDPLVPPTPTDGSKSLGKDTFVAEAMLVGLGELSHSMIVGYSSETQYSNPWIHEGFPRNSPGSALTKASDLSFHQDMSYHKAAPDILGLVCVREGHDRHVNTELVDNREVFSLLPSDVLETLKQPRFEIKTSGWVDPSQLKTTDSSNGRSLVSKRGAIHLPVDWDNMVGLDKEAQHAVELLKRAIDQAPKHDVHFVPGDLLFFSNQRTIHSRTPYTDLRFDGGDRVLIRAYFLSEMTADQSRTRIL